MNGNVGRTMKRKKLYDQQSGKCFYCKVQMVMESRNDRNRFLCTVDERIPRALGGHRIISNQVAACQWCNNRKGMLTDVEFFAVIELASNRIGSFTHSVATEVRKRANTMNETRQSGVRFALQFPELQKKYGIPTPQPIG